MCYVLLYQYTDSRAGRNFRLDASYEERCKINLLILIKS